MNAEKQRILDKYATILAEHFPDLIVLASVSDKDGTDLYVSRVGNFYAQQGMLQEIIIAKDEETRQSLYNERDIDATGV